MSEPTKKKPLPPDAWVAVNALTLYVNGKLQNFSYGELLPAGIDARALGSLARQNNIVRGADFTGEIAMLPVAPSRPLAVATAVKPAPPVLRDEHGMVKPDLGMALPGDSDTFRVDKTRPAAVTYIPPGYGVQLDGAPMKDSDGFTHVNWDGPVLRNGLPQQPRADVEAECQSCNGVFPNIETMKIHEARAHHSDSFHERKH